MEDLVERRRHPRYDVMMAVMITPNGDMHSASVVDVSAGGARVGLPEDWTPPNGAALQIFFQVGDDRFIAIMGHVTRVGVDHLGVQFAPAQEERIAMLLGEAGVSN